VSRAAQAFLTVVAAALLLGAVLFGILRIYA
jgi:hypothetical protein